MQRWGALLALILWASVAQGTTQTINTIPSSGASFLTDLQAFLRNEEANRYELLFTGSVASGCTHSTGAGLTKSISSCVAFPAGYYVSDSGSVTYADDDVCWLAVSADTTPSTIDNFVRSGSTHFLVDCTSLVLPSFDSSDNAIVLGAATTASGAVTDFTSLAPQTPFGNITAKQAIRSDASGFLEGVTLTDGQLLIGDTGAKPVAAALTAGTGIDITNGAGTITIDTEQDIDSAASVTFNRATLTVSTGTAPLTITSTTVVPNLNADMIDGKDWAVPGALGTTTPSTAIFTTLKVPAAGSTVSGIYKGTGTIDFGSTSDGDCAAASSITVTGAAAGDAVFVGPPTGVQGAGRVFYGYASATDTVSVIFCNFSGGAIDPASGTYVAWVLN